MDRPIPPPGSAIWKAYDHVKALVENGPWVTDGDPRDYVEMCSYCRHYYTIDENKAHYKNCEWAAARAWLTEAEEWISSEVK